MLNPDAIKSEEFEVSVLGGYKREAVDNFVREVGDDYEKLYTENAELVQKLKVCVNKIEEYRKDEQFLKTAIINAEKLNETTLREIQLREKESELEAKQKADAVLKAAKDEADNIVNRARVDSEESIRAYEVNASIKIAEIRKNVQAEEAKLEHLKKEVSDFKENLLKIYKQHVSSITKLPSVEKSEPKDPAPKAEPVDTNTEAQAVAVEKVAKPAETGNQPEKELVHAAAGNNEKTAEFVIEKKQTEDKVDKLSEIISNNIKFKDLKFGTDFDLNKNE